MNEYVTGPQGIRLIKSFEGKPRLTARRCEGGAWELGYGCTFWPDGRAVREGQTITEAQVELLLKAALKEVFEPAVRELVKVPITQYQFDALVALAYNIGVDQFRTSTVLRMLNQNRMEDAAGAFGMWVKATSGYDEDGDRYLSPTGEPCLYRRAFRGLLRRHYAEGCVFLGYDWADACADGAIALRADKHWEPENNRWHDRVRADLTTPFTQVLDVARRHPLPVLGAVDKSAKVAVPLGAEPLPAGKQIPAVVSSPTPALKSPPAPTPAPVGTKPLSVNTVALDKVPYKVDPNAGLKPMEESDRWKASVSQQVGLTAIRVARYGAFGATAKQAADTLEGDAVFTQGLMMFAGIAGVAAIGFVIKSYGDWKRKRGEKVATQALY